MPAQRLTSDVDVIIESNIQTGATGSADDAKAGDIIFRTSGVERARILSDGTGTGWPNVLGGSLTAVGDVTISSDTDASGAGDVITSTGGVERSRIDALGVPTGLPLQALLTRRRWLPEVSGATIVTGFASGHGWTTSSTPTGGSVTLNDTGTPGPFAAQTVTIVNGTSGSGAVEKAGLALNLTSKSLLVWFKIDTQNGTTDPAIIVFAGDASLANNYQWSISPPTRTSESGWFCAELFVPNAAVSGTPTIAALDKVRLRVNGGGAGTYSVHIGGVATRSSSSTYTNGVVSFSFDDSGASDYTLARPTLGAYGLAGTSFVITNNLGTSVAQYRQMQDELGWEVAGHAYTLAAHNTRYENLSAAVLAQELALLKQWLMTNGFQSESWASPGGSATTAVWNVAHPYFHSHFSAGVDNSNGAWRQGITPTQPYNVMRPTFDTSAGSTLANFKTLIDRCKANATWLVFNMHGVTSAASSGTSISTADLDALVAYCIAQSVSVKTIQTVLREVGVGS